MSTTGHTFTLGIEEEFAIIDPETRELRSHIHEILEGGKITLKEQIKPEMHQSVVELGTEICDSIACARVLDRIANLSAELHHGLVHLGFDLLFEHDLAALEDFLNVRTQLARLRIDQLKFLFNAESKDMLIHAAN